MNGLRPVGLASSPFYNNFAEGLYLYHPGLDFGRTKHSVGLMRRRRDAVDADLQAVRAAVALETRRSFYAVLRADRLEEVAHKAAESRQLTVRQARAYVEGEIRSKLDLDLARVALSKAQLASLTARSGRRIAMAGLSKAIGDTEEYAYELAEPDLKLPQLKRLGDLLDEAYEQRPELVSLQASREAALEAVRLARSKRKPMLSFFFTGGWARFTPLLASNLLAVGTGLQFPVHTFGKLKGAIEEVEARAQFLDYQIEDSRQQVALEVRTAYYRLEHAFESIPVHRVQTEAAGEALKLARARYREQLGTMVELNQSEAQLAEAEAAVTTALYDAKIAEAELTFAVGRR